MTAPKPKPKSDQFKNVPPPKARKFNTLTFDADTNSVTKSSMDNPDKIYHEFMAYQTAPRSVRPFLIEPYDLKVADTGETSYKMTIQPVPDLGQRIVADAMSADDVGFAINKFRDYLASLSGVRQSSAEAMDEIMRRCMDRILAFAPTPLGRQVDSMLDQALGKGLRDILLEAQVARDLCIPTYKYMIWSHGDPVFSNIYSDARTCWFKMGDPRGSTEQIGNLMHPLYDAAKFTQSAMGYDRIHHGQYQWTINDKGAVLSLRPSQSGSYIRERWLNFLRRDPISRDATIAMAGILTLSMIPLHDDEPVERLAAYATRANLMLRLAMASNIPQEDDHEPHTRH